MLKEIVDRLSAAKAVSEADVLALRRAAYGDGAIGREEADALFALNDHVADADPAFGVFFVEALGDFLVKQEAPEGYVSEENARWLMDRVARDGHVKSETELELLVRVMEIATDCPRSLAAFALSEVKRAIVDGEGPLARGGALEAGVVNEAEVALLRRILHAGAGESHVGISRAEADVLFDINDACFGAPNHPSWTDLFSKAVANSVLVASGYAPPPRDVALARAKWLDEPTDGIGGFLSRAFSGGLRSVLDAYSAPDDEAVRRSRNGNEAAIAAAASDVGGEEAAWLAERISRHAGVDANEVALLRFIAKEARQVHPQLQQLADRAA